MMSKHAKHAPVLLRVGIALVFLWFGFNQLLNAENWIMWLPPWAHTLPISANTFILINGTFEVMFGNQISNLFLLSLHKALKITLLFLPLLSL